MIVNSNRFRSQPSDKPGPNDVVRSTPMKEKVLLTTETFWSPFNGWLEKPVYKNLQDIDTNLLQGYNNTDSIYSYPVSYTHLTLPTILLV